MVGAFFHGGAIFHANSMKFCPPPYYMNIHGGGIFSCNSTISKCWKNIIQIVSVGEQIKIWDPSKNVWSYERSKGSREKPGE